MFKLWASLKKDFRILIRDRVGLVLLFVMPILLAVVITSVQNSTFELVNENKIKFVVFNKDQGELGKELVRSLQNIGLFHLSEGSADMDFSGMKSFMHKKDALAALVIPENFSTQVEGRARNISKSSLKDLGLQEDTSHPAKFTADSLILFYHPVMQQSFRHSVEGAVTSALQFLQSKSIVNNLYRTLHEKNIPDTLESQITNTQIPLSAIPVSREGSRNIPNATEHNIPAWTIFAIFFIVISLSSNVVREKLNGSFVRLRSMPTHFYLGIFSKQLTYIILTLTQAMVIFMIGIWIFPKLGLPSLHLPADLGALLLVTLACGVCASSYGICIGIFAETQEQANGFGAVSVVILAAIGGLLVPSFVMPTTFQSLMKISPLHWCLEAYYGLFLEGGNLKDIWMNILSLLAIILVLQVLSWWGLKRKNLI
jgi:ABC-2 type transport system permease protein